MILLGLVVLGHVTHLLKLVAVYFLRVNAKVLTLVYRLCTFAFYHPVCPISFISIALSRHSWVISFLAGAGTHQAHSYLRALALATPPLPEMFSRIPAGLPPHHLADSLAFAQKQRGPHFTFYVASPPPLLAAFPGLFYFLEHLPGSNILYNLLIAR